MHNYTSALLSLCSDLMSFVMFSGSDCKDQLDTCQVLGFYCDNALSLEVMLKDACAASCNVCSPTAKRILEPQGKIINLLVRSLATDQYIVYVALVGSRTYIMLTIKLICKAACLNDRIQSKPLAVCTNA